MTITVGPSVITFNDSTTLASAPGPYVGGRGQIFTANGTFTIPSGITAIKVTVQGGGGNGGSGGQSGCVFYPGGGGGSGGCAVAYLTELTPGGTLSVTVGGVAGNSTVASGTQTITTISGTGGSNGGLRSAGNGGGASGGTINISGQAGAPMGTSSTDPGGAGGNGLSYFGGGAGNGAGSARSGGGGGAGFGAGGGGGGASTGAGGTGKAGIVIFEW